MSRRSSLSFASCAASAAASRGSSASRHSIPRLISVKRPAAFSRGATTIAEIGGGRLIASAPGRFEQRPDARCALPGADAPQALRNQHPVVAIQRHQVGDRSESHQIQKAGGPEVGAAQLSGERRDDIERHSDSGQCGAREPSNPADWDSR